MRRARAQDVERYVLYMRARPGHCTRAGTAETVHDRTIQSNLQRLSALYEYLKENRVVKTNPIKAARVRLAPNRNTKRSTNALHRDDVVRLLNAPDPTTPRGLRDRAFLAAAFGGGLRRGEIHKLRICDVRKTPSGTDYLVLLGTKNGTDAEQAIPAWAAETIAQYIEQRRLDGAHELDPIFACCYHTLYHRYKIYCEQIGLDPRMYSPHSARATAITLLLSEGRPHREVQNFSRHASIQTLELYDKRHFSIDRGLGRGLQY